MQPVPAGIPIKITYGGENMSSLCGASCGECTFREGCAGCAETCGKPFGGRCVAAEYIQLGGKEAYAAFRKKLKEEINVFLESLDIPPAEALYELPGHFVNLAYRLPSGENVKFLDDKKIYLGTQIEFAGLGVCYGVVADTGFILVCSYGVNGSDPVLIAYKRR